MANKITPDAECTPFSGTPIPKINSNNWNNMSLSQLHDDRYVLQQRLHMAYQLNNPTIITAIQRSIDRINYLIDNYDPSNK